MIRLSLLAVYVAAAAFYVRKDWFVSLCALILLMAVIEHPDMPKGLLGIPGLNPWNLLFGVVFVAWIKGRREEGLTWELPPSITILLLLYLGVVLVGWVRMIVDTDLVPLSKGDLVSEHLINTVKWVIPGLILFDAARTRERFRMAVLCVLAVYLLYAVQVIRWMPLSSAVSGDTLSERSLKILVNEIGFHRVNMSAMLAAGSWAMFAARPLAETSFQRAAILAAFAITTFGQALTAGRAGYVTWMAVGFVMCVLRWRKYLFLAPVLVVAVLTLAPGVAQRMLEGFSQPSRSPFAAGESSTDVYAVTAGRNIAWPLVIEKIKEKPLLGWGRLGMVRTGLTARLAAFKEGFSHPHNAYLEMLLDNGLIGFVLVMPFYALMLWKSVGMFLDSQNPVVFGIGGISCAFLFALAIASMGSQTFYPREGWVGMWCVFGLVLRVQLERQRGLAKGARPAFAAIRARGPAVRPPKVRPAPWHRRPGPTAAAQPEAATDAAGLFAPQAPATPAPRKVPIGARPAAPRSGADAVRSVGRMRPSLHGRAPNVRPR